MRATLIELRDLDARAAKVDRQLGEDSRRDDARITELDALDRSVRALGISIPNLASQSGVADAVTAWRSIERVFDVAGDQDLRTLLDRSIARESAETLAERRAADMSITQLRVLSVGLTSLAALAALIAAFAMLRALRRPLAALEDGSRALGAGDLGHRVPDRSNDEFGRFGKAVNAMAQELARRRERDRLQMDELEHVVDQRTRELRSAMDELKTAEAERRRLFADIAHELRTPTAAIRGEAEVSLRRATTPKPELRATLERVKEIAVALGRLIDDVLTLARNDSDALAIHLEPCGLDDVIDSAVRQLRASAQARDVILVRQGEHSGAKVIADKLRLVQVLVTLIDNATRYSHPRGTVVVRVEIAGGRAMVVIADEGIGIAVVDLPHVFERAYRSAAARMHRADGAGLGLAVAKALADRMDVKLGMTSQIGRGTTVTVAIAIAE
ncbi:sensor histidine kinase [Bosea thiooxidans]